jgi:uncharacterized protein YciI
MISVKLTIVFSFIFFCSSLSAQVQTAPEGYQFFEMPSGDSTIIMKQYFMCFLKTGPDRNHPEAEAAEIQKQHLAHLANMHTEGHSCVAGPLGSDGDIRGLVIYKTATLEKAIELANMDPAVKAGRLVVEIFPWWAMKGATLD